MIKQKIHCVYHGDLYATRVLRIKEKHHEARTWKRVTLTIDQIYEQIRRIQDACAKCKARVDIGTGKGNHNVTFEISGEELEKIIKSQKQ